MQRLAIATGELDWACDLDAGSLSLLAANDLVYLSMRDGGFVAYAQRDGHFRWRYPARAPAIGLPISDTSHVYIAFQDNTVQALDRYVGNQSWQAQLTQRPPTGPLLTTTDVLLPSDDGDIGLARTNNGHIEGHIPHGPGGPAQFVERPPAAHRPGDRPGRRHPAAHGESRLDTDDARGLPPRRQRQER